MAESWVRLWAGMTTDPKFRLIARKAARPLVEVLAVYTHLLMIANDAEPRGSIAGHDADLIAAALDMDPDDVQAVLDAMQCRVLDGEQLSGWDKRQPQREDLGDQRTGAMSAAERKRNQRERDRAASETIEMSRDVTTCHDASRDVTTCHAPEAEAEAEAEVNPTDEIAAAGTPTPYPHPPPLAAADPIQSRAIELTALLRKRGAALQASDPRVIGWAGRGVTDAQALAALDQANERRQEQADARPVNAGLIDAILGDLTATPPARASPRNGRTDRHAERAAVISELTGRNRTHERHVAQERDITAEAQRIA